MYSFIGTYARQDQLNRAVLLGGCLCCKHSIRGSKRSYAKECRLLFTDFAIPLAAAFDDASNVLMLVWLPVLVRLCPNSAAFDCPLAAVLYEHEHPTSFHCSC
jgi:hypothetical protein